MLLDRLIRRRRCRRDNLVGCVNILRDLFVRCVLINCDIVVGRVSILRAIFVRRVHHLRSILIHVAHEILHIFFYLCFIGGFLIHLRPVMGIFVVWSILGVGLRHGGQRIASASKRMPWYKDRRNERR